MLKKRLCLLVNPYAGNGSALRLLNKIEKKLHSLNLNFYTILTNDIPHAQQLANEAISRGETVAVLGGDGSARIIAQTLKYTRGVMGIIPAGRGNDFARMLNIPQDPLDACDLLANGQELIVDMAQVNKLPFLSICSIGFDSVANEIANKTRFIKGRAVYIYAGLKALFSWKCAQFKITIDDKEVIDHYGYTVAVANSQCYGGGMFLAPNASITDGLLDIVLIGNIKKYRMLMNLPRVFNGTHINEPGFEVRHGKRVRIEANPTFTIYADGDPVSPTQAEIEILPKALHVLVPSSSMSASCLTA